MDTVVAGRQQERRSTHFLHVQVNGMGDGFGREHDPPRSERRLRRRADVVLNGRCAFSILAT
jgi:hypothetical protein